MENNFSAARPSILTEETIVTWEAYNYEELDSPDKARLTKRGCLLQNNSDSTVAVHERHGEAHAAHNPACSITSPPRSSSVTPPASECGSFWPPK